ncbi:hypothetical protein WJX81_007715 [Elliptochloris bilobata]|uniref:Transcriptional adapter n=1 Tax=Elliptochloris bilobata TaxID=381761 RepID=A0AAW1RZN6_9CHLO
MVAPSTAPKQYKRKRGAQPQPADHPRLSERALYHCNYCQKDISNTVRIKCAVCPDFDLCLECFSVGAEVTPHASSHAYRVVDSLTFPLFHPDWGADEELLLLEAVDMYGPGNWKDVFRHVGTKSEADCKAHYLSVYVGSPAFPEPMPAPEMAGVDPMQMAKERQRARQSDAHALFQQQRASAAADAAAATADEAPSETLGKPEADGAPAAPGAYGGREATGVAEGPSGAGGESPLEVRAEAKPESVQDMPEAQTAEKAGRGPGAREARAGGADGAEAVDAPAVAAPAQHQEVSTRSMRAAPPPGAAGGGASATGAPAASEHVKAGANQPELTGYHVKRDEFDPEYDVEAEQLVAELEFVPGEPQEGREEKLRMMAIYNTRLSERERRRAFVAERGLLNVKAQQGRERRRGAAEREVHARLRPLARYQAQDAHKAWVGGVLLEGRLRARIQELKEMRRAGVRTLVEAAEYERRQPHPAVAAGAHLALLGVDAGWGSEARLSRWRGLRGAALDITALPGLGALTIKERELCATTRLLPAQLLAIKAGLLGAGVAHGHLAREAAACLFRLEPAHALRVYDLLIAAGWLRAAPAPAANGAALLAHAESIVGEAMPET